MPEKNVIAIDLGASSGRLISGSFDGGKIALKEQFRFSNQPINLMDSLYWDHLKLFQSIKYGLSIAEKDLQTIESLSVDTWGVDYGFIDHLGKVINAPHSYRDGRSTRHQKEFEQQFPPEEYFFATGVQPDTIDSVMQLFADFKERPYLKNEIDSILFMPNLIEYFFSQEKVNEFTIASTSGLLDGQTRELSSEVFEKLAFEPRWFGEIQKKGRILGKLLPQIRKELGLHSEIEVISGVGHDTAAAVLALPIKEEEKFESGFISCGTWSIVGTQTDLPIVTKQAFEAGLTNEGCYDGGNRLLKNITGLWIVQELQKEWSYQGEMVDFGKMAELAAAAGPAKSYINPNYAAFANPGEMEQKIKDFLRLTGQALPKDRGELLRIIYESLALSYTQTIRLLEENTGKILQRIFMFGGGIQNDLLVQLTADYTQKTIQTGPVEASVTGNIISQLMTLKLLEEKDRVAVLKNSFESQTIQPQLAAKEAASATAAFEKIAETC
ncbi:MAG: rhamnulokinase [Enterococcus devriesei]|uniref:rhamnulokinase n=1 Tax=Enterococcus devriesei TaxID=319970 RepID=UPI003F902F92